MAWPTSPGSASKRSIRPSSTQGDGKLVDVTNYAQWASSNTAQLTMSKTGLAELVTGGANTIAITASYQGVVGELDVTIAVAPTDC